MARSLIKTGIALLLLANLTACTVRTGSGAEELGHGRVVSMLEGGYALDALGRSAVAHVKGLIAAG